VRQSLDERMSRPKLMFLATEDWFVRSHFEHLLRRARDEGYDVAVAARRSGALDDVAGVRLIDLPVERSSALSLWREAEAVRALLREEQPALVHAIALRAVAALLLAPPLPSVFAVTGRGYLYLQRSPWAQTILEIVARGVRRRIADGSGALLVENENDLRWIQGWGPPLQAERVVLMPGAGVEVDLYDVKPEPEGQIVVGIAARLVRSKGVDVALDAISRLRARRIDIALRIAGAPDAGNPESVSEQDLSRWRAQEGVELLGRVDDINAFWANAHIACLPSRGGEGLPRSLLEAAACGRAIVTTNTPGCADFVRRGDIGLVVDSGDPAALAAALEKLAQDAELRRRLGTAARAQVEAHYTLAHAADAAALAWRSVCPFKAGR
jgi:glycosyltransferase involved in cell wall biosynthesis